MVIHLLKKSLIVFKKKMFSNNFLMPAELEQQAALKYLYSWLRNHPVYGKIAPPELSDSLYYADVSVLFSPFLLQKLVKVRFLCAKVSTGC